MKTHIIQRPSIQDSGSSLTATSSSLAQTTNSALSHCTSLMAALPLLPDIHKMATGVSVADSFAIAEYLEKTDPRRPARSRTTPPPCSRSSTAPCSTGRSSRYSGSPLSTCTSFSTCKDRTISGAHERRCSEYAWRPWRQRQRRNRGVGQGRHCIGDNCCVLPSATRRAGRCSYWGRRRR